MRSLGRFIETESRILVARGWGTGDEQLLHDGYKVSVWEDEKFLEMDGGDGCTAVEMYLMSLNCTLKDD